MKLECKHLHGGDHVRICVIAIDVRPGAIVKRLCMNIS